MIAVRIILWLLILGVLSSPLVAYYGLEDQPLVTKTPTAGASDLKSAMEFLGQLDPRNIRDGKPTRITTNERQINMALASALSTPGLKARVVPSKYGLLGAATGELPVPPNPFGRYVNIRMLFEPSSDGLQIGRLVVGEIEIPRVLVKPAFILVMDQLSGPGRGQAFLDTVQTLEISGDRITIVYSPQKGLLPGIGGQAENNAAIRGMLEKHLTDEQKKMLQGMEGQPNSSAAIRSMLEKGLSPEQKNLLQGMDGAAGNSAAIRSMLEKRLTPEQRNILQGMEGSAGSSSAIKEEIERRLRSGQTGLPAGMESMQNDPSPIRGEIERRLNEERQKSGK